MNHQQIDTHIAKELVERARRFVNADISIVNTEGKIVYSNVAERIGDTDDNKTAINIPLRVDDAIIGAIGVSGRSREVRSLAMLIGSMAELSFREAQRSRQDGSTLARESVICRKLISRQPLLTDEREYLQSMTMSSDFFTGFIAIRLHVRKNGGGKVADALAQLKKTLKEKVPSSLITETGTDTLALLTNLKSQKKALQNAISAWREWEHRFIVRTASGRESSDASPEALFHSWRSAVSTLQLAAEACPKELDYEYRQFMLPIMIRNMDASTEIDDIVSPLNKIIQQDKNGALLKTLDGWFRCNNRPLETASFLHIHRNTLEYRLNLIEKYSNMDLTKIGDRFSLYIALERYKASQSAGSSL